MNNERTPIPTDVTHYAQLKSSEYLGHWDLEPDKDQKVTIEALSFEEVFNQKTNKKEKKSVMAFRGAKKRLVLNATNMKNVASWHGDNPQKWPGKEVTLFRTNTKIAGVPTECIRVRPNTKNKSDLATKSAE